MEQNIDEFVIEIIKPLLPKPIAHIIFKYYKNPDPKLININKRVVKNLANQKCYYN